MPVEEWYNFKPTISYSNLNAEEAEEEFARWVVFIYYLFITCAVNTGQMSNFYRLALSLTSETMTEWACIGNSFLVAFAEFLQF